MEEFVKKLPEIILQTLVILAAVIAYLRFKEGNRAKEREREQKEENARLQDELKEKEADRLERDGLSKALYALIGELNKANANNSALIGELGKANANNSELIEALKSNQEQEGVRMEALRQDFISNRDKLAAIAEQIKEYVRGVGELSGNLTDQLGTVATENRTHYSKELNKRMDEERDEAQKRHDELRKDIDDLKKIASDLQEDVAAIKEVTDHLEDYANKQEPKDIPAPPATASAVVDTKPIKADKPPEENKSDGSSNVPKQHTEGL